LVAAAAAAAAAAAEPALTTAPASAAATATVAAAEEAAAAATRPSSAAGHGRLPRRGRGVGARPAPRSVGQVRRFQRCHPAATAAAAAAAATGAAAGPPHGVVGASAVEPRSVASPPKRKQAVEPERRQAVSSCQSPCGMGSRVATAVRWGGGGGGGAGWGAHRHCGRHSPTRPVWAAAVLCPTDRSAVC